MKVAVELAEGKCMVTEAESHSLLLPSLFITTLLTTFDRDKILSFCFSSLTFPCQHSPSLSNLSRVESRVSVCVSVKPRLRFLSFSVVSSTTLDFLSLLSFFVNYFIPSAYFLLPPFRPSTSFLPSFHTPLPSSSTQPLAPLSYTTPTPLLVLQTPTNIALR